MSCVSFCLSAISAFLTEDVVISYNEQEGSGKDITWSQHILILLEAFRGRTWPIVSFSHDLIHSLAFTLHMWGRTHMGSKQNCYSCQKWVADIVMKYLSIQWRHDLYLVTCSFYMFQSTNNTPVYSILFMIHSIYYIYRIDIISYK